MRQIRSVCIELHYGNVLGTPSLLLLGNFGNDNGNGSENVTAKTNSRFFKLYQVYYNSLKMSNVGRFLWSQILVFREKKGNSAVVCLNLHSP